MASIKSKPKKVPYHKHRFSAPVKQRLRDSIVSKVYREWLDDFMFGTATIKLDGFEDLAGRSN